MYLYNMERIRSKIVAENVLKLLEDNPGLAQELDLLLPGIDKKLAERPDDISYCLNSFEALLKILECISQEKASSLASSIRSMVDQHTSLFSSSDRYSKQVMSMLPESPMWNSVSWQATNIILGKSMGELMEMLESPCALRLRCNSKTTQGISMSVSALLQISDPDQSISKSLLHRLQFYSGRSLTDISTSAWSSIRLSRESVHGRITCQDLYGETLQIDIQQREHVLGILMALSYIVCNESIAKPGPLQQILKNASALQPWVPTDGHIQWSRVDQNDTIYQLRMPSSSDDESVTIYEIHRDTVYGILECLDALALLDSQFSLPMPMLGP